MPLDYSQALGNFGVRYTIRWRGRDYPVQFLTDSSRQAMEQWSKRRSLELEREARDAGLQTEQEYQQNRRQILSEVHDGLYGFWTPNCLRNLTAADGEGMARLLLVLLKEADPSFRDEDLTALAAEEAAQVEDVLDLILAEVLANAKEKKLLPAGWTPPPRKTRASPAATPDSSSTPSTAGADSPSPTPPA